MQSTKSYKITKKEFNYLLPAIKSNLLQSNNCYFFIGGTDDLLDMLNRLKGLYDNYDIITKRIVYKCYKLKSIKPFKDTLS